MSFSRHAGYAHLVGMCDTSVAEDFLTSMDPPPCRRVWARLQPTSLGLNLIGTPTLEGIADHAPSPEARYTSREAVQL
jgi:hypothetical protein